MLHSLKNILFKCQRLFSMHCTLISLENVVGILYLNYINLYLTRTSGKGKSFPFRLLHLFQCYDYLSAFSTIIEIYWRKTTKVTLNTSFFYNFQRDAPEKYVIVRNGSSLFSVQ